MINNIKIHGFKCFAEAADIPFSRINIMYGKNGRGKSTVAQSLMLLAQTMQVNNGISELHLIGNLVELGTFYDVVNRSMQEPKNFSINIGTESETIELGFCEHPEKPQMAILNHFIFNGIDRFDIRSTADGKDPQNNPAYVNPTSDVTFLQKIKLLQYVSAGRLGPKNYSERKDSLDASWYGVKGEYIINVLANKGEEFQKKVCSVLSEVLSGATLRTITKDSERIELYLDSINGGQEFRPTNVGFGYSFVLPVIVAALLAPKGSILIIENPEAHLHPGAQSRLTKFLIEVAQENDVQLFIETHSDHVVNGLRIAMKQRLCNLKPSDAEIAFFSHDEAETNPKVEIIKCDKSGELSGYPDDFLDEWTKQLLDLV